MAPNQYADCRAANRPIRGSTHGPAPTPSRNRRPIPNGHSDRRSIPMTPPHRQRSSTNRNHLYRPNGRQCKAANHVRHVPEPKPPPNANADGTAHRALGLLETRSKPTHVAPERGTALVPDITVVGVWNCPLRASDFDGHRRSSNALKLELELWKH